MKGQVIMEQLIVRELSRYNDYSAFSESDDIMAKRFPTIEPSENAKVTKLKKQMIECWLKLLQIDEYHVIRLHLIEKYDWPRVFVEYQKLWGEEFERSERTLQKYQASGVQKIVDFAQNRETKTRQLFSED